ncbi:5'-3' exoribonuclease 2 [Saccoglossus kowalevskii]|uniref:5'-3' exoribonuclease n=1 Tax=Saccoglossus kowalevskii TaxID=10224 RepID=A0ABM0H008_SACKO|nr:PREDICTED: 5'-3' exoribonuclease 2 [Saccoglossus kowalevskii]
MGVPAFFRWLSKKYPSIVVHCVEEKPKEVHGIQVPVNITEPNPNEIEFDNLYLDMNGIIHPCCHPENKPAPKNEDEMMLAIFECIDRLMRIVRPRRLLYMAIDGVAPRAKMNQQRSRRFRGPKEVREKQVEIDKVKEEILSRGGTLPPPKPVSEKFDSNCITPGTEFMFRLADCLRYYVTERIMTDPGWSKVKVILSDANVPGEGEHKIMDYIRKQRGSPDHDPNTHHCLCGADADLIMLGLATHEPYFTIIREEFKPNAPRACELCGQYGHEMKECTGAAKEKEGEFDELTKPFVQEQEFIFLRLNILREYLEKELFMTGLPFTFDFERAIDDWVFMCFFVGNDFLPHLPSLQIREGAIDRLIRIYKTAVFKTGGYLTKDGVVNLERVQMMMTDLGEMEDGIFKKRRSDDVRFRNIQKERKKRNKRNSAPSFVPAGQYAPQPVSSSPSAISNPRQEAYQMRMGTGPKSSTGSSAVGQDLANLDAAKALKTMLGSDSQPGSKRKREDEEEEDDEPKDDIRLWEDGWKDRYYKLKFDVSENDEQFVQSVVSSYVEGLCWVLRYYYQGCPSWKWYFPFHYAPFAANFIDIGKLPNDFEKGTKPFKPLEQLMGVFPSASGQFLPETWRKLMSDPDSPIIDFYPDDFAIDLNGKRYAWQGVALLPFVDEKRLKEALVGVYSDLTPEEIHRNGLGSDRLFVGKKHPAYDFFKELYDGGDFSEPVDMNPKLTEGMSGTIWADEFVCMPGEPRKSPLPMLEDLRNTEVLSVSFRDPQYPEDHVFSAKLLPGAKLPERVLKPEDFNNRNPNTSYRPQVGFRRRSGPSASLDAGGHRMVRHSMRGAYSNAPPPQSLLATPTGRSYPYQHRGSYSDDRNYNQRDHRQHHGQYQNNRSQGYGASYGGSGGWNRQSQGQQQAYQQNQQRYQQPQYGGYGHQYRHQNQSQSQGHGNRFNQNAPGRNYPTPPKYSQRRY